jgi:hypothetical protein
VPGHCQLVAASALLVAASAFADVRNASSYRYDGGVPEYVRSGMVYAVWNARGAKAVLAPGMKILFFGTADGCRADAADGPTADRGNPRLAYALQLTGLRGGRGSVAWSPSGATDQCEPAARGKAGDSFVQLEPRQGEGGGFGLFTYTGRDAEGRAPFFQPLLASGRNSTGVNANIAGSFVTFRFAWDGADRITPWAGNEGALELRSMQSVAREVVTPGRGGEVVQAKQQLNLTVINRACFRTIGGAGKLCQVQYLLNTAVYRAGVTDWDAEKWFKDARVWFDPAQGGMPIVHGPVPAAGKAAFDTASRLDLYTSAGAASQHAEFKDLTFVVRVTLAQLHNALRVATAARLKRPVATVGDGELAAEFGARWNDAAEWSLLSVAVGQEVHNPARERRAFIGGNFRTLSVGS